MYGSFIRIYSYSALGSISGTAELGGCDTDLLKSLKGGDGGFDGGNDALVKGSILSMTETNYNHNCNQGLFK